MPTINYIIPWDNDKNIGACYNRHMAALERPDDFCCFLDADAMFTTTFFGKQIAEIVDRYPECGMFYAPTNRIGCPWLLANVDRDTDDIAYHREIGRKLHQELGTQCRPVKTWWPASGHLMLVRKSTWERSGGFKKTGMLTVDNLFFWSVRLHETIMLMEGVYIYHWYRGGKGGTAHLLS